MQSKLPPAQAIQRVSQMRRLVLTLKENYQKEYLYPTWLAHFNYLRTLPIEQFPQQLSQKDLDALHVGLRECWTRKDFNGIVAIATKIPGNYLHQDHLLMAYFTGAKANISRS